MADESIPSEIVSWMNQEGWGAHHDQWHFERRWDLYHAIAAKPGHPPEIDEMIADPLANSWTRSAIQEGEVGNGEDFLFMHRGMIQLLADNFPDHFHYFRGWATPPQDPADVEDPVPPVPPGEGPNPAKGAMNPNIRAIEKIEAAAPALATDDQFGLFLETAMRPLPGNPGVRPRKSR